MCGNKPSSQSGRLLEQWVIFFRTEPHYAFLIALQVVDIFVTTAGGSLCILPAAEEIVEPNSLVPASFSFLEFLWPTPA